MKNAILEMWYGNLDPVKDFGKNDIQIKKALRLMDENGARLEEKLDKES